VYYTRFLTDALYIADFKEVLSRGHSSQYERPLEGIPLYDTADSLGCCRDESIRQKGEWRINLGPLGRIPDQATGKEQFVINRTFAPLAPADPQRNHYHLI